MERFLAPLGVYRDRRLLAILFMGFSSGLPLALSGATLQIWLAREEVSLKTIGFFALVGAAYSLKFVWAPILDRMPPPVPLGKLGLRRGWAIATQLMLMASIVALGLTDPAASPALTALCAVLVAFASASQDVVVDAYRVELLDAEQQAAGAAVTQYGYRVGMLVSGAGALYLSDAMRWSWVFAIMAALVTIGITTILLTREPETPPRPIGQWSIRRVAAFLALVGLGLLVFIAIRFLLRGLVHVSGLDTVITSAVIGLVATVMAILLMVRLIVAILRRMPPQDPLAVWIRGAMVEPFLDIKQRPGWVAILLFILLFKFGDAFAGVMANPFYVAMGFSNTEIANVSKIYGLIATMIGVGLGGILVVRIGLMPSLLLCGILQMFSNLLFSVQALRGADLEFLILTIGTENLAGGMGSAAFVAYLSILCSKSYTATQYALLSSLAATGRTLLSSVSGLTADAVGWFDFFIVSTIVALPGLLLLIWMMRRYPVSASIAPAPVVSE